MKDNKVRRIRVLSVFGTRPEAIKMAPLIKELERYPDEIESIICVTAQHREMLDSVLNLFEIKPDYDLNIMKSNQNLWSITSDVLIKMKEVYETAQPDVVLVHGDTTTSMAAALSAFYAKIPVGHIEAGLRTFDKYNPFPEEINRVFTDSICTFHFAPTDTSVNNLKNSQIPTKHIYKTGNTVIDALLYIVKNKETDISNLYTDTSKRLILVTAHRRENFGEPIKNICNSILKIVEKNPDIQVLYPVHPNPNIKNTVYEILGEKERIILAEPQEYAEFSTLMKKSYLILTDSGGVQEEAPSLGKPVLVLREATERPEAVEYGTVKLVGTNPDKIISETQKLLDDENEYKKMSEAINPYGDGLASKRTVEILRKIFSK